MPFKILIDGVIRDMTTEEEEAIFISSVEDDEATESDYITALQDLGVEVDA